MKVGNMQTLHQCFPRVLIAGQNGRLLDLCQLATFVEDNMMRTRLFENQTIIKRDSSLNHMDPFENLWDMHVIRGFSPIGSTPLYNLANHT